MTFLLHSAAPVVLVLRTHATPDPTPIHTALIAEWTAAGRAVPIAAYGPTARDRDSDAESGLAANVGGTPQNARHALRSDS